MEGDHPYHDSYKDPASNNKSPDKAGIWESQSVIALTHTELIVISANDFGDLITKDTHNQIKDYYTNYPTDGSLLKSLNQYQKWDKYKRTLVEELGQYYADPSNHGLPIHMPEIKDETHGDGYLHMYLDRKGPEKIRHSRPRQIDVEVLHPPKLKLDQFSNK